MSDLAEIDRDFWRKQRSLIKNLVKLWTLKNLALGIKFYLLFIYLLLPNTWLRIQWNITHFKNKSFAGNNNFRFGSKQNDAHDCILNCILPLENKKGKRWSWHTANARAITLEIVFAILKSVTRCVSNFYNWCATQWKKTKSLY